MANTEHRRRREPVDDCVTPPWLGERVTLEEFLALPEVKPYLEFDDGILMQKPAANVVHGAIQAHLGMAFGDIARSRRLGVAAIECRFVTPTWIPTPDVVFYRRERIRWVNGRLPAEMFEAPDIAVEIVSPGQSVTELIKKCLRYLELGTSVALLIDPEPKMVLVFRPGQPLRVLQGQDRIDLDDLLPGFNVTVQGMFDAIMADWLDEEAESVSEEVATE